MSALDFFSVFFLALLAAFNTISAVLNFQEDRNLSYWSMGWTLFDIFVIWSILSRY